MCSLLGEISVVPVCTDAAADGQHDDERESDTAAAAGSGGRGVMGRGRHRANPLHQPVAMMLASR